MCGLPLRRGRDRGAAGVNGLLKAASRCLDGTSPVDVLAWPVMGGRKVVAKQCAALLEVVNVESSHCIVCS